MLAKPEAHKVSTGIGQERHNEGNEDHIPPRGHIQDPDKRAEQVGHDTAAEEAQPQHLNAHLHMIRHHFRKQQNPERQHSKERVAFRRAEIAPQGEAEGHQCGVGHQPNMYHQSGAVE